MGPQGLFVWKDLFSKYVKILANIRNYLTIRYVNLFRVREYCPIAILQFGSNFSIN